MQPTREDPRKDGVLLVPQVPSCHTCENQQLQKCQNRFFFNREFLLRFRFPRRYDLADVSNPVNTFHGSKRDTRGCISKIKYRHHRNTIPINGRLPHSSEIMNFPKASNPLICHSALGVVSPRAHADLSSRVCVVADDIDDYLRSRFAIPRMTDWRKGH
jgi:hypothetical protein